MEKIGILQYVDGSYIFFLDFISPAQFLGSWRWWIVFSSLISGEMRGGEGKGEVNCSLVRDELFRTSEH